MLKKCEKNYKELRRYKKTITTVNLGRAVSPGA